MYTYYIYWRNRMSVGLFPNNWKTTIMIGLKYELLATRWSGDCYRHRFVRVRHHFSGKSENLILERANNLSGLNIYIRRSPSFREGLRPVKPGHLSTRLWKTEKYCIFTYLLLKNQHLNLMYTYIVIRVYINNQRNSLSLIIVAPPSNH